MKSLFTFLMVLCCCTVVEARRVYVNINATGLNNGTSWADAYTELSRPLDSTAYVGDTFWVANGVYTSHTLEPWSFHVMGNTHLYGGFNGTETSLSQRNWSTYQTVLAGTSTYPNGIIYGGDTGRVDGFKITINALPNLQYHNFGLNLSGRITIANCQITNIWARWALVAGPGDMTVSNCQFINNGPSHNVAQARKGSAVWAHNTGILNLIDCEFRNNQSTHGGAIYIADSAPKVVNVIRCSFYGNSATVAGGAIFADSVGSRLRVFNSLFVGNKAPLGGAHYTQDTTRAVHSFTHCTIAHNWSSGGGAANYAIWLRGSRDTLRNCIIWGDSTGSGPEIPNPRPGAWFSRNVIEGGNTLTGTSGTYTFNPLFTTPGTAAAAPFGASTAYNYHLSALSLAVDTAVNLGLAAPYDLDLDRTARMQGPLPDLGAYEWKVCPWHNVSISASGPTTFCQGDSVQLTASGNPAYRHIYHWNSSLATGATIRGVNGVNRVVVVDSLGYRASASITVQETPPPNPSISYTAGMLSVPGIFSTYQWNRGGMPIPGATSATYRPVLTGVYAVKVTTTAGNCPGTSSNYNVTSLSIGSAEPGSGISIYPNPATSGQFRISLSGGQAGSEVEVRVSNANGQQVFSRVYDHPGQQAALDISMGNVAGGIYFVEVRTSDGRKVSRFVIE